MVGGPAAGRWRVRPTELATIASASFLLATAALATDQDARAGLLATVALTAAYAVVFYHLLPPDAFGDARYAVAGSAVQLLLVLMLATTGGVDSPWSAFYVLPVLATVFGYRPSATAAIAAIGIAGLVVVAFGEMSVLADVTTRQLVVVRLLGYGALATVAYVLTRTMRAHRGALQRQEARLRELLSAAERDALTDALTAVHNRRALDQTLAQASSRAERSGSPYSVLLIDVDQLKEINDRAGHAAGDDTLRAIARAATEVIRGYDVVARSGGDEFVVLLHGADEAVARRTAERIARRAADLLGAHRELVGTTVSIGAATWRPGMGPDDLLAQADAQMYEAKRARQVRSA